MWPSQRLASIGLKSWQGPVQARRRDRRGIRPIVTLLEDRQMLSTLNLTVTTLADPSGPTGTVSLRQAINTANADTTDSQEVINFAAGLKGTIDLTTALPNLANNISITGPGASALTVQRDSSAVPFSVFTVNSGETVNLSGLTIFGGNSTLSGGGIGANAASLTVSNCILVDNSSQVDGGAIHGSSGTLTVTDSSFTGNSAAHWGSAINGRVAGDGDWQCL